MTTRRMFLQVAAWAAGFLTVRPEVAVPETPAPAGGSRKPIPTCGTWVIDLPDLAMIQVSIDWRAGEDYVDFYLVDVQQVVGDGRPPDYLTAAGYLGSALPGETGTFHHPGPGRRCRIVTDPPVPFEYIVAEMRQQGTRIRWHPVCRGTGA